MNIEIIKTKTIFHDFLGGGNFTPGSQLPFTEEGEGGEVGGLEEMISSRLAE